MFASLHDQTGLWALLASAFVSSTLLPGGSEAMVILLSLTQAHSPWVVIGVATLGNALGGITTWGMGRLLAWRFPAHALRGARHQHAVSRLQRWGSPILLFSWLPMVGDPLCLAAGWLRVRWDLALLFITLGKAARYAVLVWVVP